MVRRQILGGSGIVIEINDDLERQIMEGPAYVAAMSKMVSEGAEYARNLAAVDTGNMRDSIKEGDISQDPSNPSLVVGTIEVGDGAPYWVFVEYGTGQLGASSAQPDPGVAEGYNHGPSTGMPAQPFMRPTLWWLRQRFGD